MIFQRVVPSELKRKLPLRTVARLDLETAGGQGVEHVNRDVSAFGVSGLVRVVCDKPNIFEILVCKVASRRYLGSVRGVNVGRSDELLCKISIYSNERAGHENFPAIELFQLFNIYRSVINVLSEIGVSRRCSEIHAACCGSQNSSIFYGSGSRRKIRKQNACI